MTFQVDQVVWVTVGNAHEEPATVLRVGCDFDFYPPSTNDSDQENAVARKDGVLVQLHVSRIKAIHAPEQLRLLNHDADQSTSRPSRRRTTKTTKAAPLPSSSPTAESTSGRRSSRVRVTPSPVTPSESEASVKRGGKTDKGGPKSRLGTGKDTAKSQAKKAAKQSAQGSTSPYFEPEELVCLPVNSESDTSPKGASKGAKRAAKSDVASTEAAAKGTKRAAKPKAAAASKAKKPRVLIVKQVNSSSSSSSSSSESGSDSSDDEDDRPFTVEYSPSSRSTCRRCDQVIEKNAVRVSHVPLFRGKPGYRVFRHLHCAVFSENITDVEHVGGYQKLTSADRKALKERIAESLKELEFENKELEPDELVPVAFSGEIRGPPPGLAGSLLNFQVEGTSWMYHQEVNVPDIRGGILADEMGMGKNLNFCFVAFSSVDIRLYPSVNSLLCCLVS